MLLVHQAGSVKIGEVVRYTLTYTPSNDRILPTPSHLHLKVKNTSAIALRAAWIHGPYALHVSAYPATFNPHHKVEQPQRYGIPEYEPMLKAAGSWQSKLVVPDEIRETGADLGKKRQSMSSDRDRLANEEGQGCMTWIIEIASQILFSASASVDFEILVGRDERSLDLGFAAVAARGHGGPGQVKDTEKQRQKQKAQGKRRHSHHQTAGVYSKAVRLVAEDTEALWDKPNMPSWDDDEKALNKSTDDERRGRESEQATNKPWRRKKLHLVVLTHGLHSNVGADMLFMKESIDATVAQARKDARKRKQKYRDEKRTGAKHDSSHEQQDSGTTKNEQGRDEKTGTAPISGGQEELNDEDDESDEEETIVRGFSGNAARTENGIQYLGKRLAKYVLKLTYPDQPFLPIKKPLSRTLTDTFKTTAEKNKRDGKQVHQGSSVHIPSAQKPRPDDLPYEFTSISFIGHSLGGLVQTYAVAYIHKHSPTFFEQIKPVNFICMASPMLGLSNENPLYVKFALDFGLVGRTGQDLGLTWKPPGLASARGGWNSLIGGIGGNGGQKDGKGEDPGAKPLLRILPTGPAHQVLRMFRNRTLYSNVVNDGIVPLRTSCLLFLDWRGLGKVDKARRENGLIGTAAEWAWHELIGTNTSSMVQTPGPVQSTTDDSDSEYVQQGDGDTVPQPAEDETAQDSKRMTGRVSMSDPNARSGSAKQTVETPQTQQKGMMAGIWDWFSPAQSSSAPTSQPMSKKTTKAMRRAQTVQISESGDSTDTTDATSDNPTMQHGSHKQSSKRPVASKGDSYVSTAPPKTSIFESAGDILHPPMPSKQWITDPGSRARTIFHDRVYHPEDIPPPPPPMKRPGSRLARTFSSDNAGKNSISSMSSTRSAASTESVDSSGMRVEEKIARAYHRDLSWRKVLVRLEPDAHNNMIVRRMFANAYGWPVVKHLCDTHFADTYSARTRDEEEPAKERAPDMTAPIDPARGEEVQGQTTLHPPPRSQSEMREARDELTALNDSKFDSTDSKQRLNRVGSVVWDDAFFEGPDDDDSDIDERGFMQRMINPHPPRKPEDVVAAATSSGPSARSPGYTDGHRGLAPISPTSSKSGRAGAGSLHAGTASLESPAGADMSAEAAEGGRLIVAGKVVEEPEAIAPASAVD